MRIARFHSDDGQVHIGQLVDERNARPLAGELLGAHDWTDEIIPIRRLLPPLEPPNIFAIGRNYAAHAAETGSQTPENPLIFMKPTTATIASGDEIHLPESAPGQVDLEAELAIIIGRTARRVPVSRALEFVLGYTCANDVSARDCQKNDKQWSRAKGFDTFCPIGPWIVTADELSPHNLAIRSRLNGATMQESNTSQMVHSCAKLVSYLSEQFTLLPGTLILTGTPDGVGFARTPPIFLKPGDLVEVEIERIGTLSNRVAPGPR